MPARESMTNEPRKAERSGLERREGFCAMHAGNTSSIDRHTGQWKILLWGAGIFAGILVTLVGSMHSQMEIMGKLIGGMDKTLTVYIGTHTEATKQAAMRLTDAELEIKSIDGRLMVLERASH